MLLWEPDAALRTQVRTLIDSDSVLTLTAEAYSWGECERAVDEFVPELLIARAELVPASWRQRIDQDSSFLPVLLTLQPSISPAINEQTRRILYMPGESDFLRKALNQAVREVYERKAKQLLYLVERYVAGSTANGGYESTIEVKRDGESFGIDVANIMCIVAARKDVSIHTAAGNFIAHEPIHELAAKLDPAQFVRIHRSILINCDYLVSTAVPESRPFFVVLSDGSRYPVGPTYRHIVEELLKARTASLT